MYNLKVGMSELIKALDYVVLKNSEPSVSEKRKKETKDKNKRDKNKLVNW